MDIVDKLTEIFKEFPGIGERQARRFVYFLMAKNPNYGENLANSILELNKIFHVAILVLVFLE